MRPAKPWYRASKNGWYVKVNGRQVRLGVTGRENQAAAVAAWHRLMAAGASPTGSTSQVVEVVVDEYLSAARDRVQRTTWRMYRHLLRPFVEAFGALTLDALDARKVERIADGRGWSQATRRDCLATVRSFLRWAGRPLPLKVPAPTSRGAKALISPEQFAVIDAATSGDFRQLLRFLWHTGARPSEAAGLTAESVDLGNAVAVIHRHKTDHTGRPRVLYLSPDAAAILAEQRPRYGGAGHLFRGRGGRPFHRQSITNRMLRLGRRTGIHATAYGFRHSYATGALNAGIPDTHVAALLGHTGTEMLHRHYSHITAASRVLRDAAVKVRGGK